MKLQLFAVVSAFILLAVRLFRQVDLYAVNIFFSDQWVINDATLFQKHSLLEIFRWQYGPHREGLGGVISKLLEPLIQWNSRDEAFAMAGVIACACLAALWLKYRLFGKIEYFDVIIPLLFFTPVQCVYLVRGVNPSHGPLPLLLAVLYCSAWTITNDYWKYATMLMLNLLLIYTGFGLFMGFITPLLLGLEYYQHRSRIVLISLVVAIVSIATFFIDYQFQPAVTCFSPQLQSPMQYVLFVSFMFSSFVNILPKPALVIPAILMGIGLLFTVSLTASKMFLKLLRGKAEGVKPLVVSALLGYSLIFCFATAYGRICLGLGSGQAPRYMIYLILAFLGLYIAALSATVNIERRAFVCIVLLLGLFSSSWIGTESRRTLSTNSQQLRTWKECYLSSHSVEQCDARTGYFIYQTPEPPDLQPKLDFLERRHLNLFSALTALPSERGASVSPSQ